MNNKTKREVKDLERQKKKALQRNDFIEAAKICNAIGEVLSSNGLHEDAIEAHKEEINTSEAANDVIGVAVGNRKVGECLCELKRFDEAIEHQNKHLQLSKSVNNLLEQQRALATLGRTYFVQAEIFPDDEKKLNGSLLRSQKAYLKSLDICNKLNTSISDKELLEMKARLYLNLGLVHEWKQDGQEAMKFVSKALIISREQRLKDDIYRCHFTLSGLYLNEKDNQKALQSAKSALMFAKGESNRRQEMDALSQMGLVLLRLCEFQSSLQTLKKVYKSSLKQLERDENVVANLKLAMKGLRLNKKLEGCEDKKDLMSLCEKLGDFYHDIEAPEKALQFYLQQLSHADAAGVCGSSLASIYISIAVTYSDCKQHQKALDYYKMELNQRKGELKEKSATYCAMARCMEDLDIPFEEVKKTYMKGLECAQGSGNKKSELKAYNDWSATLKSMNMLEEYENVSNKINHLKSEGTVDGESQMSIDTNDDDDEEEEDVDRALLQFDAEELQLLESDSEDEIDEEEVHLLKNGTSSRRTANQSKKKANKVNERGETPLHLSAISGNAQRTSELLKQGSNVHTRDYCGWQPLHEACNHGAHDVVKLLLEHGADVSDPGGAHCGGITPLHDASQNGHLDVVNLLVSWNADLNVKNKEMLFMLQSKGLLIQQTTGNYLLWIIISLWKYPGFTPLDLVQIAIKADDEEFSSSYADNNEMVSSRKKVEKFLREANKSRKQYISSTHNNAAENRNRMLFQNSSGEESDNDMALRAPYKRQRVDPGPSSKYSTARESVNIEIMPPLIADDFEHTTTPEDLSEKIDDDDSNYESMNEENPFVLSPAVVEMKDEDSNDSLSQEPSKGDSTNRYNSCISQKLTQTLKSSSDTHYRPELGSRSKVRNNNSSNKNTKNPCVKVVQSKISFPRSPSPSMFDENDDRLQDFIINDMPTTSKSNNGTTDKRKQGRIDFAFQNKETRARNQQDTSSSSTQNKQSKRKLKQKPLHTYTEIEIDDDNDNSHRDNILNEDRNDTLRNASSTSAGPLFRMKVRIANHCFLIPCQQANELTIAWLSTQAVDRYYARSGVSTKLALKTKDDALLNPDDIISDVIMNNEEILADILGLQFPPLLDRYTKNCKESKTEPIIELLEQFSLEDSFRTLHFKDMFLYQQDFKPIFSSMSCNTNVTCIDLSGTNLGDATFLNIEPALNSLPNLSTLNVSSTGITSKSLVFVSQIVSSLPKEEYRLIMKNSPLSALQSLHFSYNDFSSDKETFAIAMTTIIKHCLKLEELHLCHCFLTGIYFQQRKLREVLKESNLKVLDISHNFLGTWYETVDVVSMLNLSTLKSLNLSSTSTSKNLDKTNLKALTVLLENNESSLKELQLNRLPAISETDENHFYAGVNVEKICMRYQSCTIRSFHSFIRDLTHLQHLSTIDLSYSSTFNEDHLDCFLHQLKTDNSLVVDIILSSCNICSRLPERLFKTLLDWRSSSSSCKLKTLELSYNNISQNDKGELQRSWEILYRTIARCNIARKKCFLYCDT